MDEKWRYAMFLERGKTYNKITKAVVERHVANIKDLDDSGHLEFCGVFRGYPGVAAMLILKADSFEDADALCKREPLVIEGYATYSLRKMLVAEKENNFLMP